MASVEASVRRGLMVANHVGLTPRRSPVHTNIHDFVSITLTMEMPMWIQNLLKSLTSTSTRRRPTRRPASRLFFEPLEDRRVPSFTVSDYDLGNYSSGALAADFNNDLVPDLALTNGSAHTVSVLL